jgi:hypothetical protein
MAQPVDDQMRAAARAFGEEGLSLYDQGKYDQALDKFERADALIHAPTLGLMAARCLDKLGKLVEASERYRAVANMKLEADASDAFKEAQSAAVTEREALLPRIPKLEIVVQGQDANQAEVLLDGKVLPKVLVGVASPVNPGKHHIEAKTPTSVGTQEIDVPERETSKVVVILQPTGETSDQPPPPPKQDGDALAARASLMRTAAWASFGVGGAGLVIFAVGGGVALSKQSTLDEMCGGSTGGCPKSASDTIDSYNASKNAATAGLVIAALGGAAGAVLLLTAPKPATTAAAPTKASIQPWISIGSAGLRGTF